MYDTCFCKGTESAGGVLREGLSCQVGQSEVTYKTEWHIHARSDQHTRNYKAAVLHVTDCSPSHPHYHQGVALAGLGSYSLRTRALPPPRVCPTPLNNISSLHTPSRT